MFDNDIDFRSTPDFVREMCMNWFLKCACIREVLPRIYLELALVSCRRFMQRRMSVNDLMRLAYMVRGIAEPLSASYTATYLARIGQTIDPSAKDYLLIMIEYLYKHWNHAFEYGHSRLETKRYMRLFEPAIEWIFQCMGSNATEKYLKKIIKLYMQNSKQMVFLRSIISYFPPDIICKYADDMLEETKAFNNEDRLHLLKAIGIQLIKNKPRKSNLKLMYLNFGWEELSKTQNSHLFMDVSTTLVEFAIKNMKSDSVNTFISEIFKRFRDFVKVGEEEELY